MFERPRVVWTSRVALLELLDRVDRLDAVPADLLLTGGDREGQAVDDDVLDPHAPVLGEVLDEAERHAGLPLRGAGLPLLVDAEADDRGAVLLRHRHDLDEARLGAVAVLVVHRVDGAAPAELLEPGLQHLGLGGVEHHRQRRGGGDVVGQAVHVGVAVTADVVDAEVHEVRALAGLRLRDLHALLVVVLDHGLAERLRAVGVRTLADHEEAGVLAERHGLVHRREAGLRLRVAGARREVPALLGQRLDVRVRRAAAAADELEPVVGDERGAVVGELVGLQGVLGAVRAELGQAGVGHHRDRDAALAAQGAQVLAHLGGAGGAVQADAVDAQGLEGRERRGDLGADEHRAGELDGDVADDRDAQAVLVHRAVGAEDGRLGLEEVLAGLDEHGVRAALEGAEDRLLVVVAQQRERRVAQRRQLGARPVGREHEARPVGGGVLVGGLSGDLRALEGELADPLDDVVLVEVGPVGAEGVGLDDVGARLEVPLVHTEDGVGTRDVQDLVAALEVLEVVEREILVLECGAHGTVSDEHPRVQGSQESRLTRSSHHTIVT